MLRLALKGALARRLRLGLTAAAIVIGVAFVSGTLVLTDTLNATFDQIFGRAAKNVDVVVRGQQAFEPSGDQGGVVDERALVPESAIPTIQAVPGVGTVTGDAGGYAQVVYRGKAVVNGAAPNLGVTWVGDSPVNPLDLVAGSAPIARDDVVIDERSAEKYDIRPGTPVTVVVAGRTYPARVTGIVKFGEGSSLGGATLTAFPPDTAQRLLIDSRDAWTVLDVTAEPGISQEVLRGRIAQALGDDFDVLTARAFAADQSEQVKSQFSFFSILLLVFGFISVFVAVFIIFNTFTVLVAQRTRELALLRALGAARRQVLRMVVLEAGLVGLLAGIVGLGGGVLVAAGLRALISAFGGEIDTVALQVRPRTVVIAMLVAVVVTITAALVPAWRASRVPPVAAMRDDFVLPSATLRRRTILGSVLLSVGVALLVVGVQGDNTGALGIGAVGTFTGAAALSPLLSRPIVGGIGRVLPRFWATPGRLARENSLRNPRRTAATASALMIGIALTTTMSILAASITTSVGTVIDDSVGADFLITNQNFAPVSESVAAAAVTVDGVGSVTEFRAGSAKIAGDTVQVQGATSTSVATALRLTPAQGRLDDMSLGDIIISEEAARDHGWHVGSHIEATFALTGRQSLTVHGIYEKNQIADNYVIGLDTYAQNFRNRLDVVIAVNAVDDEHLGVVRTGLAKVLKPTPTLKLQDQSEYKADLKRQINQVLIFVLVLLVLSLIIAWLGIINTLALSVFERTREIGLLRAVGMARVQVRRMVRLEAVVIAVFGALLGIALGLGYGAALVQALSSEGIGTTAIPWIQLVAYLVVGVLAGITAALWPAYRASRLDVLQAIATE